MTMSTNNSPISLSDLFSNSFVEYARRTAELAHTGQTKTLQRLLMAHLRLLDASSPGVSDAPDRTWVFETYKTILGLGILVAANQGSIKEQKTQLEQTLLRIVLGNGDFSRWTQDLALAELCYVDQFLVVSSGVRTKVSNLRAYLSDRIRPLLEERAWCPPIRDYLAALGKMTERAERIDEGPEVFFVGSVKGGVGKSLVAAALLYELGRDRSCALIDLDVSGPTAQYYFNVPAIAKALSALPGKPSVKAPHWKDDWQYASSYGVFAGPRGAFAERKALIKNSIYPVLSKTKGRHAVVPLPDSPTFCGLIERFWRGAAGQSDAVIAIDSMIEAVAEEGFENVVLDLGSGLSGVHSDLLRWITNKYRTHGIIVSTPRVADLVTSLYEASWMAARGEYRWEGPLVHLVNCWTNADESYKAQLAQWVDVAIANSLESSLLNQWDNTDSSTQVIAFRLWSVLYLLAVPDVYEKSRLVVADLPYDPELRDILSFPTTSPEWKGPNLDPLMDREWTRRLLEHLGIA